MKLRILACLAALWAAVPAVAQKRYIVRAPAATVATIAAANGLTVLHQTDVGGQVLALLGSPSGRMVVAEGASVLAVPGMPKLEVDRDVTVPVAPGIPALNQSTVAILDALKTRTLSSYYGDSVWTSYLNQSVVGIIRLPEAQRLATGAGTVAVIDTGVDPNHPTLRTAVVSGYDFIRNQPGVPSEFADLSQSTVAILDDSAASLLNKNLAQVNQSTVAILDQSTVAILDRAKIPSCFGHGTMVASLIRLVAPTAKIMPLKAFQADGTGTLYDVVRAIYYAADAGARVINMSFSIDQPSDQLLAAISYANSRNAVCVGSAGNNGTRTLVYPAGWRAVVGVASTSATDTRSTFSNYGDDLVSLAAPGEGLIVAWPGRNYAAVSGTSFSAPLVSGAAALLVDIDRDADHAQIGAWLLQAHAAGQDLGAGRLDLFQSCWAARSH